MKAIWRHQPKKYNFRWAQNPGQQGYLSGIIVAYEVGKYVGQINVRYDPSFVTAIGRHMSYGISKHHPAFLVVNYNHDLYEVWCSYLGDNPGSILLWQQQEKPLWYKGIKQ